MAAMLQLSVAVGETQVAMAHVSVVVKTIFVGQAEIVGFIVSTAQGLLTFTVKEQIPALPFKSVAR
jgi:hypothetical protein